MVPVNLPVVPVFTGTDCVSPEVMSVAAQDHGTLTAQGRMSQNRGEWGDDLSQVFRRFA